MSKDKSLLKFRYKAMDDTGKAVTADRNGDVGRSPARRAARSRTPAHGGREQSRA